MMQKYGNPAVGKRGLDLIWFICIDDSIRLYTFEMREPRKPRYGLAKSHFPLLGNCEDCHTWIGHSSWAWFVERGSQWVTGYDDHCWFPGEDKSISQVCKDSCIHLRTQIQRDVTIDMEKCKQWTFESNPTLARSPGQRKFHQKYLLLWGWEDSPIKSFVLRAQLWPPRCNYPYSTSLQAIKSSTRDDGCFLGSLLQQRVKPSGAPVRILREMWLGSMSVDGVIKGEWQRAFSDSSGVFQFFLIFCCCLSVVWRLVWWRCREARLSLRPGCFSGVTTHSSHPGPESLAFEMTPCPWVYKKMPCPKTLM